MDGMKFQALGLVAATLAMNWMVDRIVRFWRRSEDGRRREDAAKVLRAHGMEAHAYLPSFAALGYERCNGKCA